MPFPVGLVGLAAVLNRLATGSRAARNRQRVAADLLCRAPIIGGTALAGGYVSIPGAMLAVLLIGLIENMLVLAKVDPYWVQFALGVLVLVTVGLNRWRALRVELGRLKLSINAVSKSFPSVRALDDVSMDFAPGEIHALMGENGAGKSTLIKIITGVHRPDAGEVSLDGKPVVFGSPRDALAAGIGAVHQERNLIPRFSVGENILLEHLPTRGGLATTTPSTAGRARCSTCSIRASMCAPKVATLSVAQMQLVEIAKALSAHARVLLLDEPTASITDHEAAALFRVLHRPQGRRGSHRVRQPQARRGHGHFRPSQRAARRPDRRVRRVPLPR